MRLLAKLVGSGSQKGIPFWRMSSSTLWSTFSGNREELVHDFEQYVRDIYRADGVVFACIAARAMVFAQARFMWQRFEGGRPTDMFGTQALRILEVPWPNASTGDLLTIMEQDVSIAGNCYLTIVKDPDGTQRFRRLRPDWVTVVTASRLMPDSEQAPYAPDAFIHSYVYAPPPSDVATRYSVYDLPDPGDPLVFAPADIVHYTEWTDPLANWRGMSWLTPVIREIQGNQAATEHKLQFFRQGATPAMVVRYDSSVSPQAFERFVEYFKHAHEGSENAYRTLHLGGGADITPLTMDFRQLDFRAVQGLAETRIAAAAGAHPVIVGLSEGLQGSSLNAGNFQAARRLFVDGRIRYLWSKAAPALQSVLEVPPGCRLWYDDRDIPFLRDDAMAEAQIRLTNASTIRQLIDAGFDPERAVEAVVSGDLRRLSRAHTGLFSVQLQPLAPVGASNNGGE